MNGGRLTEEQYWDRLRGGSYGAAAAVAIIIAVRGGASTLSTLALWAGRNPDKVQQLAQGLTEAGGGPPGLLTLGPKSRLNANEISTGMRLAKQLGVGLKESAHDGAEYVVAGAKNISIDAMGTPDAYKNWARDNGAGFFNSILKHVNKSNNYTAIDLNGDSKEQIKAIEKYVSGLTEKQRNSIIYVR